MPPSTRHSAVLNQLAAYEQSWQQAHADVKELHLIEEFVKVGVSVHALIDELCSDYREKVFRGVWPADPYADATVVRSLQAVLKVTDPILARADELEAEYGSVDGLDRLRASVDKARRDFADWRPARLAAAVGSRDMDLSPEDAEQLDRILAAPPRPIPDGLRPVPITADELRRLRERAGS